MVFHSHFTVRIPEVVAKILSYLTLSDLLPCTRVSSIWEVEARKYILKLGTTRRLCCEQVSRYFDDMAVRGHIHGSLSVSMCDRTDCLATLLDKLKEENCLPKVTSLATRWVLGATWSQHFELWAQFTNLETLALVPMEQEKDEDSNMDLVDAEFLLMDYNNRPELKVVLPSVQTLVWVGFCVWEAEWILDTFAPTIYEIVPNAKNLRFLEADDVLLGRMIHNILTNVPQLINTLSIVNTKPIDLQHGIIADIRSLPFILTRLDFTLFEGDNVRGLDWYDILSEFASTLEHISIRGVRNFSPSVFNDNPQTLSLPILPKLQVLQILRHCPPRKGMNPDKCHHPEREIMELGLKFETGTRDGCVLDYSTQFPSLLRLEVGKEVGKPFSKKCSRDDYWFETCLPFLFASFLPPPSPQQGPCTTLQFLDVPTPSGRLEKLKGMSCKECSYLHLRRTGTPNNTEMETSFSQRVLDTFPNLKNIQKYKHLGSEEVSQERVTHGEKMREWLQLGEKLGLVTGLEHLG